MKGALACTRALDGDRTEVVPLERLDLPKTFDEAQFTRLTLNKAQTIGEKR
jgi:hypothetical protein